MNFGELVTPGVPINPEILESAVLLYCGSSGPEGSATARQVLEQFSLRDDLILYTEQIISSPCSPNSKFIFLGGVRRFITESWMTVPQDFQEHFRNFMSEFNKHCAGEGIANLTKMTGDILVEVAKYDWPEGWIMFIPELIEAGNSSPELWRNSIEIINAIAVCIKDDQQDSITSVRAYEMQTAFEGAFSRILELAVRVFDSGNIEFISASLDLLSNAVSIVDIDPGFLGNLCTAFLGNGDLMFRVIEILENFVSKPTIQGTDAASVKAGMFGTIVGALIPVFDAPGFELNDENPVVEAFITTIPRFLSEFYDGSEAAGINEPLTKAMQWIMQITYSCSDETFILCIDFWLVAIRRCNLARRSTREEEFGIYTPFLKPLEDILIRRTPALFAVKREQDKFGIERWSFIDCEFRAIYGYNVVKSILSMLGGLSQSELFASFTAFLNELTTAPWNPTLWNSFCFSLCSVANILEPGQEAELVSKYIQALITMSQGGDVEQNSVIAIQMIYLCAKCNRFLSKMWVLLEALIKKILSFLEGGVPIVQVILVHKLKALMTSWTRMIMQNNPAIIEQFVASVPRVLGSLPQELIPTYVGSVADTLSRIEMQNGTKNLTVINSLISMAIGNIAELTKRFDPTSGEFNLELVYTMKLNTNVCSSLSWCSGAYSVTAASAIPELIRMIHIYTEAMGASYGQNEMLFLSQRKARRSIFNLLDISITWDHDKSYESILFPDLIFTLTSAYISSPPPLREGALLTMFESVFGRYPEYIGINLPRIFGELIVPAGDFVAGADDYGRNALGLAEIIRCGERNCMALPYGLPIECMQCLMEIILHGAKSTDARVCESFVLALSDFYACFPVQDANPDLCTFLHENCVNHAIFLIQIITDTVYKQSLSSQMNSLYRIMSHDVMKPRYQEFFTTICEIFPTKTPEEFYTLVSMMVQIVSEGDMLGFRMLMTEFLISMKRISPQDPDLMKMKKEEFEEKLQMELRTIPGYSNQPETPEPTLAIVENLQKLEISRT